MKTFALSVLVAVATLVIMWIAALSFFTGAGIIFPTIVAWVAGSLFALERRPRRYWLHVAAIGLVVGTLVNSYGPAMIRMFSAPDGVRGGPNMLMPIAPPPK